MKKSTSIILGIVNGLNVLKVVLYLVFIALLIVSAYSCFILGGTYKFTGSYLLIYRSGLFCGRRGISNSFIF